MYLVVMPNADDCTCVALGTHDVFPIDFEIASSAYLAWVMGVGDTHRAPHYRGRHVLNVVVRPRATRLVKAVGGGTIEASLDHVSQHHLVFVDVKTGTEYDWTAWQALANPL